MEGILYPTFVMGGLGVVFGALLAFASEKFYVEVDERQSQIREILPGANCGGCGYPGCDGYAEACVNSGAKPTLCAPGGPDIAAKIAEIMGVAADISELQVAFVKCRGTLDKTLKDCLYSGFDDCRSAAVVPGRGPSSCSFGCLGFGTCVKVCTFDAINIRNGVAVVDNNKCVACGTCVAECPRSIIALMPKKSKVHVGCSNPHKAPFVKKVCSAGCIGCTLCVKTCPKQAISMQGSVAVIDPALCVNCGLCVAKCPVKVIVDMRPPRKAPAPRPAAPQPQAQTQA